MIIEQRIDQANIEIDNLRAAFAWSRENSDIDLALGLASSLQPLWHPRRIREGLTWFDTALADLDAKHHEVTPAVRARVLADRAFLGILAGAAASLDQAQQALAIAREVDDPALLVRAFTACGYVASFFDAEASRAYLAEAIGLARELGDPWRLTQILAAQAFAAGAAGNPLASRVAAEEGRNLADAIGDQFDACRCRTYLGRAQLFQGDLAAAAAQFAAVADVGEAAHDEFLRADSRAMKGWVLAYQGDIAAARAAADVAVEAAAEAWWASSGPRLLGVGCCGPGRRRCRNGAGRDRGGRAAHGCIAPDGGGGAPLQSPGRAGGRGSGRGPPLGRRRRVDNDGRVPVGGADGARPRGDRAR